MSHLPLAADAQAFCPLLPLPLLHLGEPSQHCPCCRRASFYVEGCSCVCNRCWPQHIGSARGLRPAQNWGND